MNLYLMRKNQHLSKLLTFIGENYIYFNHDDQDTFNLFYRGAVKYFPMTFNWMPYNYRFDEVEFEALSIVHFCGDAAKPWKNHSYVDDNYTLLKNYYRCSQLAVNHLLNRQPRVKIFTDDTGIFASEKHKIESLLMQLEANVDIYVIYDERRVADYLYDYAQLSPYVYLVAQKQKSRLQMMQEILQKDATDYVYCLFGNDYLDTDVALYELTSIAKDYQADIVFSTYKRLDEAKGSFAFYHADGQVYPVLSEEYQNYQQRDFANLHSLQGLLIRSELLTKEMNQTIPSEQELLSAILEKIHEFIIRMPITGFVKGEIILFLSLSVVVYD